MGAPTLTLLETLIPDTLLHTTLATHSDSRVWAHPIDILNIQEQREGITWSVKPCHVKYVS